MGIRKSVTEDLLVAGTREAWLSRCAKALENQKFKKISTNTTLGQTTGVFKPLVGTLSGDICITAMAEGANVRLHIAATANVDNVYALGRSPGGKLIEKLKEGLGALPAPAPQPAAPAQGFSQPPEPQVAPEATAPSAGGGGIGSELAQLVALRDSGAISQADFDTAKTKLLA